MAGNTNLHRAKKAKNDEFYTQLNDIAKEMKHYRKSFSGKIIYCNADDPTWSAFWEYFHLNFEFLGLKKLISTHYNPNGTSYKKEYTGGNDADITIGEETPLSGNGDYRNEENIEILKTADIVVTNPPFSLFKEYIAVLVETGKDYILIGNKNAYGTKNVFLEIKNDRLSVGFNQPDAFILPNGETTDKLKGLTRWFTTLVPDNPREKWLTLTKSYSETQYPKYDNFDAININRVKDIPSDYYDVMGVPLTFIDNYNPKQFEIIGYTHDLNGDGGTGLRLAVNGKVLYNRVLIKRKTRK